MVSKHWEIYIATIELRMKFLQLFPRRCVNAACAFNPFFLVSNSLDYISSRPCKTKSEQFNRFEYTEELDTELDLLPSTDSKLMYLFGKTLSER